MNASKKSSDGTPKLVSSVLRGIIVWLVVSAALIFAASFICYMMPDPDKYLHPAALAALFISTAAGGFASGKRGGAAIYGLLSGLIVLAVVLLAATFKGDAPSSFGTAGTTVLYCIIPVSGLAGGFVSILIGSTKSRKTPAKVRKRRKGAR